MPMHSILKASAGAALVSFSASCPGAQIQVTAINRLPLARVSQTIEVSAKDLAPLGAKNLNLIHVKDSGDQELICQAIDDDGDALRTFDAVLFQSDFAAGETRTFTLTVGAKQTYKKEQFKGRGRLVRERFDDFA